MFDNHPTFAQVNLSIFIDKVSSIFNATVASIKSAMSLISNRHQPCDRFPEGNTYSKMNV